MYKSGSKYFFATDDFKIKCHDSLLNNYWVKTPLVRLIILSRGTLIYKPMVGTKKVSSGGKINTPW